MYEGRRTSDDPARRSRAGPSGPTRSSAASRWPQVGARADRVIAQVVAPRRAGGAVRPRPRAAHPRRPLVRLAADDGAGLTLEPASISLLGHERDTPVIERWNHAPPSDRHEQRRPTRPTGASRYHFPDERRRLLRLHDSDRDHDHRRRSWHAPHGRAGRSPRSAPAPDRGGLPDAPTSACAATRSPSQGERAERGRPAVRGARRAARSAATQLDEASLRPGRSTWSRRRAAERGAHRRHPARRQGPPGPAQVGRAEALHRRHRRRTSSRSASVPPAPASSWLAVAMAVQGAAGQAGRSGSSSPARRSRPASGSASCPAT